MALPQRLFALQESAGCSSYLSVCLETKACQKGAKKSQNRTFIPLALAIFQCSLHWHPVERPPTWARTQVLTRHVSASLKGLVVSYLKTKPGGCFPPWSSFFFTLAQTRVM